MMFVVTRPERELHNINSKPATRENKKLTTKQAQGVQSHLTKIQKSKPSQILRRKKKEVDP